VRIKQDSGVNGHFLYLLNSVFNLSNTGNKQAFGKKFFLKNFRFAAV
jgi:hypothetical protein